MQELVTGYGLIEAPIWDAANGLYFSDVLGASGARRAQMAPVSMTPTQAIWSYGRINGGHHSKVVQVSDEPAASPTVAPGCRRP